MSLSSYRRTKAWVRRSRTPTSRSSDRQRGEKLPVSFAAEVMPSLNRALGSPTMLDVIAISDQPSIVTQGGVTVSSKSGCTPNRRGRNGAVRSFSRAREPATLPNPPTPSFAPSSHGRASLRSGHDADSNGDIGRHRQSDCRKSCSQPNPTATEPPADTCCASSWQTVPEAMPETGNRATISSWSSSPPAFSAHRLRETYRLTKPARRCSTR